MTKILSILLLVVFAASAQVTTVANTNFPAVRTAINNNFSWLNLNKAGIKACDAGEVLIATTAANGTCASLTTYWPNASFRSLAVSPASDAAAGVFRKYNSGQTANILEIQDELNGFIAGFKKDGSVSAPNLNGGFSFVIDGGGSAITTGLKGFVRIPYSCTASEWTLLGDQTGSVVIDLWKDAIANFPPTVADTITASAKPTLSSAQGASSTTLTGWTTAVTAGDVIGVNVDSVATVTRLTLQLFCTR